MVLLINIIVVFSFRKQLRRDNRGIRVSLSAKLDILRKCQEVILDSGIKLTEKCTHSLRYLDSEDFLEAQKDAFIESTQEMALVEKEISGILFSSRKLTHNDEVELLKSLLKDVNESLRTSIATYNTDVLGYNYWVSFFPCKYVFLLFKFKTKRTI